MSSDQHELPAEYIRFARHRAGFVIAAAVMSVLGAALLLWTMVLEPAPAKANPIRVALGSSYAALAAVVVCFYVYKTFIAGRGVDNGRPDLHDFRAAFRVLTGLWLMGMGLSTLDDYLFYSVHPWGALVAGALPVIGSIFFPIYDKRQFEKYFPRRE